MKFSPEWDDACQEERKRKADRRKAELAYIRRVRSVIDKHLMGIISFEQMKEEINR